MSYSLNSSPPKFPNHFLGDALTDVSFIKWTTFINNTNSNLFLTSSTSSNFVDLYEFNKFGFPEKRGDTVKRWDRFKTSDRITSISDARNGTLAYGCKNGTYGILQSKSQLMEGKLSATGTLRSMGNSNVSAIDLKDHTVFIGTENGKIATENIQCRYSRKILVQNQFPIKSIFASSSNIFLTGYDMGAVCLWDLRDREENVIKNFRTSSKTIGTVKCCHLKDDHLAIIGTTDGIIRLLDMRYSTEKYLCLLRASQKAITSVRFAENSSTTAFVTCYDGYLIIKNDTLTSLWFNDNELDVSPWLKGNHYDKLQTIWFTQVTDLIGLDTLGDKIIMGSNGGDLRFVLP